MSEQKKTIAMLMQDIAQAKPEEAAKGLTEDDIPAQIINLLSETIHKLNENWWKDLETGEPVDKWDINFILAKIALCHSELSEALEGARKDLMDDKLPERKMFEVELADTVIRIFDMAAAYDMDLGGAIVEKLEFNRNRADHKVENRKGEHGKKA